MSNGVVYQFGGSFSRSGSLGAKRGLDAGDDEEDTTPTKRAAKALESDENLCREDFSTWNWTRSPRAFGNAATPSQYAQPCSTANVASYESSATCADLSCGESGVFERSGLPDGCDARRGLEASSRTGYNVGSSGAGDTQVGTQADRDSDLQDMIRNLYGIEAQMRPSPHYLTRHSHLYQPTLYLEASMRTIAVSWLVEVACEFGLHQETLFLASSLLDRFLSQAKAVPRSSLQLVSVACMLIAAKHEEELHPSVEDFTNIADNCFTTADLLKMESLVLQSLAFRVNTPTSFTILSLFRQGLPLSQKVCALASYFTELAMLEYVLLQFQPSVVAAAALLLAQASDGSLDFLPRLQKLSGYTPAVLRECCEELLLLHHRAFAACDVYNPYTAVKDKYRDIAWHCVSHHTPLDQLPHELFASA